MTIDEAIQDFRQLENEFEHYMCDTEDKKENLVKYQREWEYYKQLAEWLEELKKYKAINYPKCSECAGCTLWNCDCANIRGKAIDGFVQEIRKAYDSMKSIPSVEIATANTIALGIAEKLKEGGIDGNEKTDT